MSAPTRDQTPTRRPLTTEEDATEAGRARPPIVVVLGPPGAGKGTQCRRLARTLRWVHLALGDALREEMARGSGLGERVRGCVERGALVPDGLAVEVAAGLLERHARVPGVLFDGFPRTIGQAEALTELAGSAVRLCVVLVVPRDVLVSRLLARGRPDDRAAIVRRRLLSYGRDTRPVIAWYGARGLARDVDAHATPDLVTERLTDLVGDVAFEDH